MPSEFFNPADHLLDLVSIDPRKSNIEKSQGRVSNLIQHWRGMALKPETGEEEQSGRASTAVTSGKRSTSMLVALPVVLERSWKNLWRRKDVSYSDSPPSAPNSEASLTAQDFLQPAGANATFGWPLDPLLPTTDAWTLRQVLLILPLDIPDRSGAQDRIGLTIESTTAIPFVGLLNAAAIFPMDRNLYLHEAKSSARYSPATFLIAYTLIEVPSELLGAFGYAAIVRAT